MLRDGGGYPKGAVVDPREGIARTLVSIGAAEYVKDKLDTPKDEQPKRAARKRSRSKKSAADGSVRDGV